MTSKREIILSPSLLSADFGQLKQELNALEQAKIKWVHWDVMDGSFVPNITLGPTIIAKCRDKSELFFDVHLMVDRPERYLEDFRKAGADLICIHAEACTHLESALSNIEALGAKPAVALNPHTPLEQIEWVLPQLYMVLIMSVNPGFGGQKFISFCYDKIAKLSQLIQDKGSKALIQVDGGVDLDNAGRLAACGANVLVSGSAFFSAASYQNRHQEFIKAAEAG